MRIVLENSQPFEPKTKDFLEHNIITLTREEIEEIFDSYINYRCEEADKIRQPISWFEIDALLNQQELVLPMDFSTYFYSLVILAGGQKK